MLPFSYIAAARLDPAGQHFQGDIFAAALLLQSTPEGGVHAALHPAILLTPTCDFALKAGGDTRQLCAIEVFAADSLLRAQFAQNVVPQHVVPLPPLDPLLPHGGAVLLRRASPVHAAQVDALARATTLNEAGLRALLVGHARYYLRTAIDGAQIKFPADDPRVLWSAIDDAAAERKFIAKRDAVEWALELAIAALAQHHGVAAPSVAISLSRLHAIAERKAASAAACSAINTLVGMEQTLKDIYQHPPRDSASLHPVLERVLTDLERVARVLQEQDPAQFNEQRYRALLQAPAATPLATERPGK